MNSCALLFSHEANCSVSDRLTGHHERHGRNDYRENRDQLISASDAVEHAETAAACIFNSSNLGNKVFRHAERIENVAASHNHSPPLSNDCHHHTNVGYRTNYFATFARNRFRVARTTGCTTLHRVVASISFSSFSIGARP